MIDQDRDEELAGDGGPEYVEHADAGHEDQLDRIAWYASNSDDQTHEVGQKDQNPWGLFDMLGNVWEWCADTWREGDDGEATSAYRVVRGGCWIFTAQSVRAAFRDRNPPSSRDNFLGFRCSSSRSEQAGQEGGAGAERS